MSKSKKELIKIHVKFTVLTPDQLKQIVFGLDKDTAADGTVSWKITFSLATRASKSEKDFTKVIDAEVAADLKDVPLAEETATKGLNKPQSDHLALNVTTTAERVAEGKLKRATLDRSVKATLRARNA
jgi:hypothetical protein